MYGLSGRYLGPNGGYEDGLGTPRLLTISERLYRVLFGDHQQVACLGKSMGLDLRVHFRNCFRVPVGA